MEYQAIIAAPFGKLGIRCSDGAVTGIEFLSSNTRVARTRNDFTKKVGVQLAAYFADADFQFDLPIRLEGTEHQRKVWRAMCAIPPGRTLTYGELALQVGSSARAVGQACGNNPISIIVPCHRVVGKDGLGGFMHRDDEAVLNIKRWLLAHERR